MKENRSKVRIFLFFACMCFSSGFMLLSSSTAVNVENQLKNVQKAMGNPRDSVLNNNAAGDYYTLKEYQNSLLFMEKALTDTRDFEGSLDELYTNYADILFQMGQLEEALQAYQAAIAQNPIHERALLHYEITLTRLERHQVQDNSSENEKKEDQQGNTGQEQGEEDQNQRESGEESQEDQQGGEETPNASQRDTGDTSEEGNKQESSQPNDSADEQQNTPEEKPADSPEEQEGKDNPSSNPQTESEQSFGFTNLEDYFRSSSPQDAQNLQQLSQEISDDTREVHLP